MPINHRSKHIARSKYSLITNKAGYFGFCSTQLENDFFAGSLDEKQEQKFSNLGLYSERQRELPKLSNEFTAALRQTSSNKFEYAIIVPTLRCNLNCSYCQVSRANENAAGYDWDANHIESFVNFVSNFGGQNIKIEFQGGEPSLRLDLVKEIIEKIKLIRPNSTFVICTNLSLVNEEFIALLKRGDLTVSSSLDGPPEVHQSNRTKNQQSTGIFFDNLKFILKNFGPDKISLLPTIADYTQCTKIIDFFSEQGLGEIFLRPVNYQGFARKKFTEVSTESEDWLDNYIQSIDYICEKNTKSDHKIIETGLAIHLSRIFNAKSNNYVDLRNPNPLGKDYFVFDYDGTIYPTDEARMLSRIGLIDLKIGDLSSGLNEDTITLMNSKNSNYGDPVCDQCTYQPYCGVDNIDKISRYGTTDIKTSDTHFCKTHYAIFDYIMEKIAKRDEAFLLTASLCMTGKYEILSIFGGRHID